MNFFFFFSSKIFISKNRYSLTANLFNMKDFSGLKKLTVCKKFSLGLLPKFWNREAKYLLECFPNSLQKLSILESDRYITKPNDKSRLTSLRVPFEDFGKLKFGGFIYQSDNFLHGIHSFLSSSHPNITFISLHLLVENYWRITHHLFFFRKSHQIDLFYTNGVASIEKKYL